MNIKLSTYVLAIAALGTAFSAQAHDPKEHMKDAEAPNCASMHNMEQGHMDMDDPVMMAMMQQCMDEMHGNKMDENEGQAAAEVKSKVVETEELESKSEHDHSEHHHSEHH